MTRQEPWSSLSCIYKSVALKPRLCHYLPLKHRVSRHSDLCTKLNSVLFYNEILCLKKKKGIVLWQFTLTSLSHKFFNSGSPRIVETMSAPWRGGLLYIGLASCCNWLLTATACFSSSQSTLQRIVKNDWDPSFWIYLTSKREVCG